MSHSRPLCIGLDGHKESIAVAYVAQEHEAEVMYLGTIGTRQCDIENSCASGKPTPTTSSLSMKRAPGATGASVIWRKRDMAAGWSHRP